jgi:hypothetical protein
VNTQTGQHSRDLPQEVDDENPEGDLAGLTSQSSSRSGTSAGLGMGASTSERSESSQDISNTTLFRRAGTPEPWVKKLADDGMSYYYWNKINGQIEWTRPETDITAVFDTTDSGNRFFLRLSVSRYLTIARSRNIISLDSATLRVFDINSPATNFSRWRSSKYILRRL